MIDECMFYLSFALEFLRNITLYPDSFLLETGEFLRLVEDECGVLMLLQIEKIVLIDEENQSLLTQTDLFLSQFLCSCCISSCARPPASAARLSAASPSWPRSPWPPPPQR